MIAEVRRLAEDATREKNWKRWGPYLAERQWATVREDYSPHGTVWDYFPHEHARSRAYRWGEDGLLGITDRECRLCFALALWNGKDPILKERLFGLTGPQGNHGEDVKECYFYLDSTPTHSYLKALYKYPQAEFPYARLLEENRRRGRHEPEFELSDTGIFDGNRYFDVLAEYAKAGPDDILIRITIANRGPEPAPLHVLPTLWYRNTWSWGAKHEGLRHQARHQGRRRRACSRREHVSLGRSWLAAGPGPDGKAPQFLFTENETNTLALFGVGEPDALCQRRVPRVSDPGPGRGGESRAGWHQGRRALSVGNSRRGGSLSASPPGDAGSDSRAGVSPVRSASRRRSWQRGRGARRGRRDACPTFSQGLRSGVPGPDSRGRRVLRGAPAQRA